VAGILARAVFRVLGDRARDAGIEGTRGGGVVVIQRFGGALNLNVHFHALVLDGVFGDTSGRPVFHRTGRLTTLDVAEVLAAVEALIARRLRRLGLAAEDEAGGEPADLVGDEASGLAADDAVPSGPCHAQANGFSLHAALVVPAGQRARLERVCRYALRPPVATERLARTADGQVWLRLRAPWRDGTTGFLFDPVDFLGRLAVLVPRPRVNLMLYYGVLGARSAWRADVVGHAGVRPRPPFAGSWSIWACRRTCRRHAPRGRLRCRSMPTFRGLGQRNRPSTSTAEGETAGVAGGHRAGGASRAGGHRSRRPRPAVSAGRRKAVVG
jgi:hypothetical protein